jgi:putative transcriptional regulator
MRTRIKELRARHDMTQLMLAQRVGVRRETIHFIEKGVYNPSLLVSMKIAKAFESTVEEIFLFDEEELTLHEVRTPVKSKRR